MEKHRTLEGGERGGDAPGGATVGVGPLAPDREAHCVADPLVHPAAAFLPDPSQTEPDQGAPKVAPAKAGLEETELGRGEGGQGEGWGQTGTADQHPEGGKADATKPGQGGTQGERRRKGAIQKADGGVICHLFSVS